MIGSCSGPEPPRNEVSTPPSPAGEGGVSRRTTKSQESPSPGGEGYRVRAKKGSRTASQCGRTMRCVLRVLTRRYLDSLQSIQWDECVVFRHLLTHNVQVVCPNSSTTINKLTKMSMRSVTLRIVVFTSAPPVFLTRTEVTCEG